MRTASETARLKSILDQLPQPQTVLELGCGDSPDALTHYAADLTIRLIGIDSDGVALRSVHFPSLELIQADIVHLPFHMRFDLIVIRHPDIDRHAAAWRQALMLAPAFLSPGGVLLVTVYSLPEIERIDTWMRSLSLVCFALAPNKLTPPGLQGRDRFIHLWRNV